MFSYIYCVLVTVAYIYFVSAAVCLSVCLYVQLPRHTDLATNEFYLTIRSTLGEMFMDKQLISFSSNSRGMIVVKTDKPIYKPSQTSACY